MKLFNDAWIQVPLYGRQVIVNLVDQKKAEGRLEASLKSIHKQVTSRFVFSGFFCSKKGSVYAIVDCIKNIAICMLLL